MAAAIRTSRYHYAAMRRAEDMARGLSVQSSVRGFLARFDADTTAGELNRVKAVRDSYYLLAAAHRAAGQRLERRENRARAWVGFRNQPVSYTRAVVRDTVRNVRRAVNV